MKALHKLKDHHVQDFCSVVISFQECCLEVGFLGKVRTHNPALDLIVIVSSEGYLYILFIFIHRT